jgi:peptidoglycan/xylan/chitin deacetylase (PgdA/CDA1 family)
MRILMYHAVLPSTETSPVIAKGHVHVGAFERHLAWLRRRASVVTFAEAVDAIRAGARLSPRTTVLTFDDGLWNQAELAFPFLERYELPATFFVPTDPLGSNRLLWFNRLVAEVVTEGGAGSLTALRELRARIESNPDLEPSELVAELLGPELPDGPEAERLHIALGGMSNDQVATLSRSALVEIAGHTVSHPRLTACSTERIDAELVEGRRTLETLTGKPIRFFAYPEGGYEDRVVEAVRRAGYEAAAAVESSAPSSGDEYRIPRLVINQDPIWRVVAKWAGLVGPLRRVRSALGLKNPSAPPP